MAASPRETSVITQKKKIDIHGARVHNLKNVCVSIPRNRLVVVTGPSGSGKSSLAFDTLYAEGQRQYIESLSIYSRQFFHQLERPDVDRIEGLQPTISIDQHASVHNPRSTVATMTEIHDYLRLLYARLGVVSCGRCGRKIRPQYPEHILETLMSLKEGTRLMVLAPIVRHREGDCANVLDALRRSGYLRARVDQTMVKLEEIGPLQASQRHTIEAVVDRVVVRESSRDRLSDSIQQGLRHGGGILVVTIETTLANQKVIWRDRLFTTQNICPVCGIRYDDLEPRMFSFNSPYGTCKVCHGFGYLEKFDPESVIANTSLSLASGAVQVWGSLSEETLKKFRTRMMPNLAVLGIQWNTPLNKLGEDELDFLLYGSASDRFDLQAVLGGGTPKKTVPSSRLKGTFLPNTTPDDDDDIQRMSMPKESERDEETTEKSGLRLISPFTEMKIEAETDFSMGGLSASPEILLSGENEEETSKETSEETLNQTGQKAFSELSWTSEEEILRNPVEGSQSLGEGIIVLGKIENLRSHATKRKLPNPGEKVEGILDILGSEYQSGGSHTFRAAMDASRVSVSCPTCGGSRLRPEIMNIHLGHEGTDNELMAPKAIHEVTAMSIDQALEFFSNLEFDEEEELPIAEPLVTQILSRLHFLQQVGLSYLTLDRATETLSGGELQRVRLAGSVGSGLVGVCYVLDEPSIGLHPRDNQRLIETLRQLQQMDNTVLVVEHDDAIMRQSDWLIDMGPGAGSHGGNIVAQGTPQMVQDCPESLTGKFLRERGASPEKPRKRRRTSKTRQIVLENAQGNNLQDITVAFPLHAFVCVTGVSGSGKSSLLNETLAPALIRGLGGSAPKPKPYGKIRGANKIDKVICVDQSPIGRTPRSNPATYLGIFDEIRRIFAETREAKQRGYKIGRFSFNVKGGRCEHCQGQGVQKIEMNFLPNMYVVCPECQGKRFRRQTLEILYKRKSIADVLDMQIEEAVEFFGAFPSILRPLESLVSVGLGYLQLGQSSTTLSGGEAQRIKLAAELSRPSTGNTLYVLDEPTTGLHFADIQKLLNVLHGLVDKGNTVFVIEHNLDVIASADWIVDLGPEGGNGGGQILAQGTPETLATFEKSYTGHFLKDYLPKRPLGE